MVREARRGDNCQLSRRVRAGAVVIAEQDVEDNHGFERHRRLKTAHLQTSRACAGFPVNQSKTIADLIIPDSDDARRILVQRLARAQTTEWRLRREAQLVERKDFWIDRQMPCARVLLLTGGQSQ